MIVQSLHAQLAQQSTGFNSTKSLQSYVHFDQSSSKAQYRLQCAQNVSMCRERQRRTCLGSMSLQSAAAKLQARTPRQDR